MMPRNMSKGVLKSSSTTDDGEEGVDPGHVSARSSHSIVAMTTVPFIRHRLLAHFNVTPLRLKKICLIGELWVTPNGHKSVSSGITTNLTIRSGVNNRYNGVMLPISISPSVSIL